MPTRAQLIADLKSRGIGGKLSKMNKTELLRLSGQHGGRRQPIIELEPLPEATPAPEQKGRGLNVYQQYCTRPMAPTGQADAAAVNFAPRKKRILEVTTPDGQKVVLKVY